MTLDPKVVTWLLFSLVAVIILSRMMDQRRAKLAQMLQTYVEARVAWTKKRAKATRLAQGVAREKAVEEAELADVMQSSTAVPSSHDAPSIPPAENREAALS